LVKIPNKTSCRDPLAGMIWIAWIIWRDGPRGDTIWLGVVVLLIAALAAVLAVWKLRTGRTPLTVERSGRVSYGEKELCSAGQVQSVRLVAAPSGDGAYDVCLDLEGGTCKEVPGFAYGPRENALAFARELAAELRVPFVDAA